MKLLWRLAVAVGAVVSWVAVVYAAVLYALLFWELLLIWVMLPPEYLPVGKERIAVLVGMPVLFAFVHFYLYAQLTIWARYNPIAWHLYGRKLGWLGIAIYLLINLGTVSLVAYEPQILLDLQLGFSDASGDPSDNGVLLWLVCYGFGTLAMTHSVRSRGLS